MKSASQASTGAALEAALSTYSAARDLIREGVGSGILDDETIGNLTDADVSGIEALTPATFRGLIDAERAEARRAERARLAAVLEQWRENRTISEKGGEAAHDVTLIRRLLAEDY